jgi:hypothetical protein
MNKNILTTVLFCGIALAGGFIAYKVVHLPKQSELVVLFCLLFLYPIFRYPMVGLYAAFFIAPFIPFVRRLYYLMHGRPGIDPLIMLTDILVVIVFIGLFFEFRERLRDRDSHGRGYLPVVAVYLVYIVFRAFVFNILPISDSLTRLKYYAPNVMLFFIGFIVAQRIFHLKVLWNVTFAIAVGAGVYGIKQLFIGYSTAEKIWFSTISFSTLFIKGVARPFSVFQAPAAFADYLILGIIAAVMFASWGTARSKVAAVIAVPVLFYGVLITSVRSSWIGALSVFFFWFVFVKVRKAGTRILVIAAVAAVFFTYQLVDDMISTGVGVKEVSGLVAGKTTNQNYVELLVTTRAGAITNPFEEHSLLSRMTLWTYLFDSSLEFERALLGRGLGSMNADSLYMTYLGEFGYPGMLFIIFLVIAFIMSGLRTLGTLSDPRAEVLVKGIVVMDMVFALMNITGSHIHSFPGDMYFWFFNGVLINIRSAGTHDPHGAHVAQLAQRDGENRQL